MRTTNSTEQLKTDILKCLYASTDLEANINRVLEMVGTYFEVDRAYIFENSPDDLYCDNTFEWCNTGINPEIQNLQHLSYRDDLGDNWMENYNEDGLFFCPDITKLPPKQREVLEPQGIIGMLHCSIMKNGLFKGYVGFDDCSGRDNGWENDREATDALIYTSRLLSLVLLEYRSRINIEHALTEAEHASLAKSEFLSRMSHEIRTPMNAIIGMTAIAKENQSDYIQVAECLENIDNSSHFLLTLINDILEMSRIESGRLEITKGEFDFKLLFENIKTIVEPLARDSGIRYDAINRVEGGLHYKGDQMRVQQVLVNIINNAIKFTKRNGRVRFTVEVEAKAADYTDFCFTVEDTGIGMAPQFLKKMFQPFTQEDGGTTSKYGGSGLGLAITKSLIDAMGGTIECESFVGIGTTFSVRLRLERLAASEQATGYTQEVKKNNVQIDAVLRGSKVLMAEDHPLNVMIAQKLLERKGVIITVAENGQLALDKFKEAAPGTYDAILMDIRMPLMDGLTATKSIRGLQRSDAKAIPIIAMTANALEEDRQNSRAAGMNAHLAKPFEPAQLYSLLADFISSYRTEKKKKEKGENDRC